jgi:hypothetical protein
MAQNAGRLREATGGLLPSQRPVAGHAVLRLAQANEALAQSRPHTPEALRLSGDVSQRFLSVMRGAGLSNEEIGGLLRAAGTGAVPLVMRGSEMASDGVPSSREELLRQLGTRSFMGDPQQLAPAIEFLRGLTTRP